VTGSASSRRLSSGAAAAVVALLPLGLATAAGGGGAPSGAGGVAATASTQAGAPGTSVAGSAAPGSTRPPAPQSCVEHVPEGKERPTLDEKLPARGTSGHVAVLEVVVHHGKGETVMPHGFRQPLGSDQNQALEQAGFILPHPDGGAPPSLEREDEGERAKTTVRIPVVPLPEEPGRTELTLPPLPIAVARASGELITLCTKPHPLVVDDPIANTPDAKPRDNPPPRRQLEEWTTAKHVVYASLIALVVGGLVAWLVGKWLRRPRPAPPGPPPRPPWEVALEELHDLRLARLVDDERFTEHFDRVSFTIRKYLGDRYGFDGLESTTREILSVLRRVVPPVAGMALVERFLRKADLVKFARLTPNADECATALEQGEEVVQRTIPALEPTPPADGGGADPEEQSRAGDTASTAAAPKPDAEADGGEP